MAGGPSTDFGLELKVLVPHPTLPGRLFADLRRMP